LIGAPTSERFEAGDHRVWERLSMVERAHYWAEHHASLAATHKRQGNAELARNHIARAQEFRLMSKGEAR